LADRIETEDLHPGRLGTPRFPLSADGQYLAACLGSPVTVFSTQVVTRRTPQQLVVMDWKSQRVAMLLPVPSDTWTFESGPLVHRGRVYVAMRQSGVQSECHVACFEIVSQRMVWRSLVCAGVSLGGGELHEITHNLLTLQDDMVFINTSLGAVAALDGETGKVRWLVEYPRQGTAEASAAQPAWHVRRDLTPCLYDRGMLYVAPPDCAQMFCLDAFTGRMIWETEFPGGVFDGTQLVAVQGDQLLVAGRRLWWLDRHTGRLSRRVASNPFPAGPRAEPAGAGRPVVAGDDIYWPVAGETDEIYVLDFASGRMLRQPIRMPDGLRLGNLCVARGILLVANESQVYALDGRPAVTSHIPQ
jgi:outer membrane protein assembly factor BamB